ncbi:MAG: DUF4476 domain-containing protein [Alphaproteobacteria bacterium]|nr:DUF4476 domain-containing protein [Alphaproteobacteria bacterium]
MFVLLLTLACAPHATNTGPQTQSLSPSANVYLRNTFDTDPSSYLGRFLPTGAQDLDEGNAMPLVCSQYIRHRFIDAGGVRYNELLNVSTEASARLGIPIVASGQASGSRSRVARVQYTLTGKMVAEIADPEAFASCCKQQPDQCTDRYVGEFLQGTGAIYHEAAQQLDASGQGLDPSSGTNGEASFSHGTTWQRAAEFDQPVYFAFKVTPTPYTQGAVSTCPSWVDAPPPADGGIYVVGRSPDAKTEQAARNKALNNASMQALRAAGITYYGELEAGPALRPQEWCVEPVNTDKGTRYTAHVLGFLPDSEIQRLQAGGAAPTGTMGAVGTTAGPAGQPGPVTTGSLPPPPSSSPPPSGSTAPPPVVQPGSGPMIEMPTGSAPSSLQPAPTASSGFSQQVLVEMPVMPAPDGLQPTPAMAERYAALRAQVQGESFASDRLAVIIGAAPTLKLTTTQAAELVKLLSFDNDKVAAIQALAGSLTDPQNGAQLADLLSFSSDKETVRGLFR